MPSSVGVAWRHSDPYTPLAQRWASAAEALRAVGGTAVGPVTEANLFMMHGEIERLSKPRAAPETPQDTRPRALIEANDSFAAATWRYARAVAGLAESQRKVSRGSSAITRSLFGLSEQVMTLAPPSTAAMLHKIFHVDCSRDDVPGGFACPRFDDATQARLGTVAVLARVYEIEGPSERLAAFLNFLNQPREDQNREILVTLAGRIDDLQAHIVALEAALTRKTKGK